ncbi:MAG: RibD family protein [Verrucomicrobiales bacterium]|nr:RibD family protein [Verrucomicrobiales bacterium]
MPSPPPRPFVLLNMAMSADGKIATANRRIETFGSSLDHAHLLDLRATADAVICGARTAGQKGITLDPGGAQFQRRRLRRGLEEFHYRVVVSGSASLDPDADLFRCGKGPSIVLVSRSAPPRRIRNLRQAANEVRAFGNTEVDLREALRWLRREHGIRRLVCEGGPELNDALLRAHLIDEIHLTWCPKVVGGQDALTWVEGTGLQRLADAHLVTLQRRRQAGHESFLVFRVSNALR